MSHLEINLELCRALGIDTAKTTKVVLTIEAGKLPMIEVHRFVKLDDADKLQTAITMLQLKPAEPPEEVKPLVYPRGGFLPPGKTYRVGE